jgi:Flp pilus assembly pilin Flp
MLNQLLVRLVAWFHREEGQDLIEYALITAVISVAIITGLVVLGLTGAFQTWVDGVAAAING